MPTFDGGHYFLTVLAPVATAPCPNPDGSFTTPLNALRSTLETLPTAQQSPDCLGKLLSPFVKSSRTHFSRMVTIDLINANGDAPENSLILTLKGFFKPVDLLLARPEDRLSCPYLFWSVDFDAASGDDASLDSYLTELWAVMEGELTQVFRHCTGFDANDGADGFCRYIRRCRIETTLPFSDYWITPPPLPTILNKTTGIILLVVFVTALLLGHWGLHQLMHANWLAWLLAVVVGLVAVVVTLYYMVLSAGAKPWVAAPNSDLPNVLKSLYVQQRFTHFAVDMQGADPDTLHVAFGKFIADHKPATTHAPTQPPGIIRSDVESADARQTF